MKCRCCKPIEPERAAKGRKFCASCCQKSAARQSRIQSERRDAGVCLMCCGAVESGYRRCAECRAYQTARRKAIRHAKTGAPRSMLARAEDWA